MHEFILWVESAHELTHLEFVWDNYSWIKNSDKVGTKEVVVRIQIYILFYKSQIIVFWPPSQVAKWSWKIQLFHHSSKHSSQTAKWCVFAPHDFSKHNLNMNEIKQYDTNNYYNKVIEWEIN